MATENTPIVYAPAWARVTCTFENWMCHCKYYVTVIRFVWEKNVVQISIIYTSTITMNQGNQDGECYICWKKKGSTVL